jgi:hypothetical protein
VGEASEITPPQSAATATAGRQSLYYFFRSWRRGGSAAQWFRGCRLAMPQFAQPAPPFPEPADPGRSAEASPSSADGVVEALLFVVAPEASLPTEPTDLQQLEQAQRIGIRSALALRMFRAPAGWTGSLDDLVGDGRADGLGQDPFAAEPPATAEPPPAPERRRLICDAVIPQLEARSQWVGVYALTGVRLALASDTGAAGPGSAPAAVAPFHPCRSLAVQGLRCLDRFPLREADNETCWFYPTDDDTYLAWENQRRVETLPGFLPERPLHTEPVAFQRADLHVLWSLMADDLALTCVGLTYRGRRIEWTVQASQPEPFATWTAFRVDSSAEATYNELAAITVFQV